MHQIFCLLPKYSRRNLILLEKDGEAEVVILKLIPTQAYISLVKI